MDASDIFNGLVAFIAHIVLLQLILTVLGIEDGVKGGETAFYLERGKGKGDLAVEAPLSRGTALFHRHGQDCLLHEGRPVLQGGADKWVLRSDVCF